MNSYPSQWNQMPAAQYFHPSWEAVSPQNKEGQSGSSCTHEFWPLGYGYPVPMQCHNCCSHAQHPTYYNFRPPCSHIPPPPPPPHACHHFYGGYPPYPQPYPMYYAPPPYYSMDLPRYEYDKNVPRDQSHCCGCLNHPCHTKGRNNVRIEEHEPDVETKKNEASLPAGANNKFPYPIMWIPPEYTMNKEQPRRLIENDANQQLKSPNVKKPQVQWLPVETESKQNDGSPLDRKPHQGVQSAEQDPNSGYGWIPLDINRIKQLMEGGNAKQSHDQKIRNKDDSKPYDVGNKGGNKQLSYPIFWMPYDRKAYDSSEGQVEKTDGGVDAKESPANSVVPRDIEHTDSKVEKQRTAAGDDDGRTGAAEVDKKRKVRTIPVKQVEDSTPKVSNKEGENKQDAAKNATNAQSSSSTKKSKLPPICLRVDPPKKKTVGGSSRSVSPPRDKKRQDSDESNSERKCQQPDNNKEIKVKHTEDKTPNQHKVEVSHGAEENENASKKLIDQGNREEKAVKQAACDGSEKVEPVDCRIQAQKSVAAKQEACQEESRQDRKVMSETEAAVIIQTAYRGHDVRRSDPIKKLREIAQVHEEGIQLKKHLDDLESCPAMEDREKAATGEAIMKLLLKLDTIQGLHQSIRDMRRSVAKELIALQEKLDSLVSQKSNTSASQAVKESSTASALVEEPSKDSAIVEEPFKDSAIVEQPFKDSAIVEQPSKDTTIVEEPSNDSGLVDTSASQAVKESSTASAIVEEPSNDSGLVEGSEVIVDAVDPIKDSYLHGDKSTKESEGRSLSSSLTQPLPYQDTMCGFVDEKETRDTASVNIESQREPHDDIMAPSTGSEEDAAPDGLGLNIEEKSDVSDAVQEKSPEEFQQLLVDNDTSFANSQNDLGSGNKDQSELFKEESDASETAHEKSPKKFQQLLADMSSSVDIQNEMGSDNKDQDEKVLTELPQEVFEESVTNMVPIEDITVQKDVTWNKNQEDCLSLEHPGKVNEESPANVSIFEDRAAQKGMVAGIEDQEADNLLEVLREEVGNEKDIQLTEQKPSELASLNEEMPHGDAGFPNEQEPCEDSGSPINEQESLEDAGSACKVDSLEQDVEILNLPLGDDNDDGKELTEVETSRRLNIDQEMDHPSESQEEDVMINEHGNHEPVELSSKETLIGQEGESNTSPTNIDADEGGNKVQESAGEELDKMDEVPPQEEEKVEVTEGGSEMGNVECPARTESILDGGGHLIKLETIERECPNDDGSSEISFEDQGSVVVGEKDDQIDKKILEENEKLRGMLEKLLASGKEQQEVISSLNGKVKDLEKKLKKKKVKSAKHPRVRVSRPLCGKPSGGSLGERPMGIAS